MHKLTGIGRVLASTMSRERRTLTCVLSKVLSLDEGGLPETEFRMIMVRCGCGLIMTKRVFHSHQCMKIARAATRDITTDESAAIIDLTMDEQAIIDLTMDDD
jgi:hypothetical protein